MKREHARDLFLAFETRADHFNAHLYKLIHKADGPNRFRIGLGFPEEVAAFGEWYEAPTGAIYEEHFTEEEMDKMKRGEYVD